MNGKVYCEVAMKTRVLLLTLVAFMQGEACGSQPKPDWFETDKAAATLLLRSRRDIAVAAAASGEKAEAMRIWLVAANANPARPLWLRQLAKHGLKDDLAAFYRDLAKKLPASDAPAKALKILQEQK